MAWETDVLDGAAFRFCQEFLAHFFRRGANNIRQAFDECGTVGERAFEEGKRAMMKEYQIGNPDDEVAEGEPDHGGVPVWMPPTPPAGATAI